MAVGNFFGGQFFGGGFFGSVASTPAGSPPSGGVPHDQQRTRKDISRARKRLGLEDEISKAEARAEAVIREVARRQAETLELDKQKQFDELSRELRLNKVEWEGKYLEALNVQRQIFIDIEIGKRLNARLKELKDEEELMLMVLMASILI